MSAGLILALSVTCTSTNPAATGADTGTNVTDAATRDARAVSDGRAGSDGAPADGGTPNDTGRQNDGASTTDAGTTRQTHVGQVFWAVDLPNEYACVTAGSSCATYICEACKPMAVIVVNPGTASAQVTVQINQARPGKPLQLKTVAVTNLTAGAARTIELPMREVDCTTWAKDSAGRLRRKSESASCLSSRAFRITSSAPIAAWQLNPGKAAAANGASLLLPAAALGADYRVLGWPAANPHGAVLTIEGVPDATGVTIVGSVAGTQVTVSLTHPVKASPDGKIQPTAAGSNITATLGAFDVLHLSSKQTAAAHRGDLSGTRVVASHPVVVFSSGERINVPAAGITYQPKYPGSGHETCCADHFEQQLLPPQALGSRYAIGRSPPRSSTGEPDFYRVLATTGGTIVTTDLDHVGQRTLAAGAHMDFWSTRSFVLQASQPVLVAQLVGASTFARDSTRLGDPELLVLPATTRFVDQYAFSVAPGFSENFIVISAPAAASVTLNGKPVAPLSPCTQQPVGVLGNVPYVSYRCAIQATPTLHRVHSDKPASVVVYGYAPNTSYGFVAGTAL